MNASPIYIAVSIVMLIIVALLVFFAGRRRRENKLTPMAGLAFASILAGILFGGNRLVGYGLLAMGVILAVIDMFNKSKGK